MKIFIGADHRGFKLKEKVAKFLFDMGYDFRDMGAEYLDLKDDYTVYAQRVASFVSKVKGSRGILLCGSGVGIDITVNKFDGIRASVGKTAKQIAAGRRDDDMNVLVIASDFTTEREALEMLKAFLETGFSGKSRYKKRLEEIKKIEANN